MNEYEFLSHENTPEDDFVKEYAIFRINVPVDVVYFRKKMKDNSMFWAVGSVGITKNGKKVYIDSACQDSKNLERKIKSFLDNKEWQGNKSAFAAPHEKITSMSEVAADQSLPF